MVLHVYEPQQLKITSVMSHHLSCNASIHWHCWAQYVSISEILVIQRNGQIRACKLHTNPFCMQRLNACFCLGVEK